MQTVGGGDPQVMVAAGRKRGAHQRRTGKIINRILMADPLGKHASRQRGAQLKIGNQGREADADMQFLPDIMNFLSVKYRGHEPAEQCGGCVVRVSFN